MPTLPDFRLERYFSRWESIASTYDGLGAEDILCFAGANEAIYLATHVLLNPGDHAVVVTAELPGG